MKSISLTTVLFLSLVAGTLAAAQEGSSSSLHAAKDHKRMAAVRQVPDVKVQKATVAARVPVAKDHKRTEAARAPVAKDHNPVQAAQEPKFVTLVARPKDHKRQKAAINPEPTQVY